MIVKDKETEYTDKEQKILKTIHDFCKGSCAVGDLCAEEECKLWIIETIITEG